MKLKASGLLLLLFALCTSVHAVPIVLVPADNANIEYAGRIDFTDSLAPRFSYSGVSVRARFQGTAISASLQNDGTANICNVIVDGVVTQRITLSNGEQTIALASGLADTTHEIELYKLTESSFGKTRFRGFVVESGKALVPLTTPRTRVIAFVGDSITCGSGIEGASTDTQTNTNQNHYLSYAAITSRNFNARHIVAAKSGIGLYANYSSNPTGLESPKNMKNYYERMHWNDATPLYGFSPKPDVICVNLGTNDFSVGVNEAAFERAYYDFIALIHAKNPGVDIVCLVGPMLSGYNLNHIRPIVQRVATTANAANNGRVFYFEMSEQGALGTGAQNHPNVAQHALNAGELTAFISRIKSWPLATPPVSAAEPKRIYIANDDHTDFMWTADADTYARTFVEMIDFHLKLADETAGNSPPYRHRFNCDGSYWLWTYEQRKSPAEFARLMERVKDGTISAPLNTLVSCYGGQPSEAVLRGMYYAGRLERRHAMKFTLAVAMEDQTLPLGLASLFAGAGAKYSWRGICGCATRLNKPALGNREREIYWWTGKDGQRLLLKWYSQTGPGLGGYLEADKPAAAIRYVDSDAGFLKRYVDPQTKEPYRVAGIFGYGGDDLARKTGITPPPEIPGVPGLHKVVSSPYCDHFHVIAKQESNERRQVIVSNEHDFFEDFEKTHGATLDSKAVTYGNEWDLYSASMSETSGRAKRAVEKLRSAELLAALVSLKYPAFMQRHTAARDRASNDLGLYWEHNWTADGPISRMQRAAWQEQVVTNIEAYVNSIQGESIVRLGGMIPRPEKANRFFVLNPLGWARTDAADFLYNGSADIHVRDLTTNLDVPHQIVKLSGARHLRILASDVPSAGYKVFEIRAGKGTAATDDAATVSEDASTFENEAVKLIIERDGAIRSLIDKKHGNAELAASIGELKINDFAPGSDEGETLRVENRGPVSVTLRARSEAGLDHTTAITLYRGSERVDIRNELTANFNNVRHWAFSFALENPAVHTEEVGAINLNKRKSEGGDYADSHARYDYITVNHFADISDGRGGKGVTLSNPDLAFAKLGASTVEKLDTSTPQLNLLAGGQVDGPKLGIPAQNGQTHFLQRFALRAHGGYDQTAAMKFVLEHQNPFVTGAITGKGSGVYPQTTHSLITVSNPDVLLWALKVHDDGIKHGLVARLWNLSEKPAMAEISVTPAMATAHRTTHIETDIDAVPLTSTGALPANFKRQQMQTYRFNTR